MKTIAVLLAYCGFVRAGDIQLTVHWVELSHTRTTSLLAEGTPDLFQRVRQLVKAKEAKLVNTQILRSKPGEKAYADSVVEIIYPTEYEPADLPYSAEYVEKMSRRMEGWGKVFPYYPMFPAAWTGTFETREVGESLQGGLPSREMPAQSWSIDVTQYKRDIAMGQAIAPDGKDLRFPEIERFSFDAFPSPGSWQLTALLTPKGPEGAPAADRKVLVFARTDVLGDD